MIEIFQLIVYTYMYYVLWYIDPQKIVFVFRLLFITIFLIEMSLTVINLVGVGLVTFTLIGNQS